ncbi:hypothetical protein BJX65DRAFT_300981 [Aspergillus insuetus]
MPSPFFWDSLTQTFFYDEESGIWAFQEESLGDTFVFDEMLKTGFKTVVSNIAASLTQCTFDVSDKSSAVTGTAYVSETYVHVQWAWLVLPASLLVLGNVFLALTILTNKRNLGSLWKSSAMALLYHGLEKVDRGDGDGNENGCYATVSRTHG